MCHSSEALHCEWKGDGLLLVLYMIRKGEPDPPPISHLQSIQQFYQQLQVIALHIHHDYQKLRLSPSNKAASRYSSCWK